ncbi:hypothetical protein IWW36_002501 [Coemansia brasiliensis]|uniref:RNA polymerase II-associated protein 3 n=1 Tax=Coemansia brasiliensis TaxID=2650707 RepID=A0A9W8I749_9FUNG|nr:hypothetical protein IWW36_002501 [Coemansia brasiliensis]
MPPEESANQFKSQGDSAFKQGKYAKAIDFYSQAICIDSTNAVLFTNQAMAFLKLEKYTDAAENCSKALRLSPDNVKALWRRGVAYYNLGQLDDAQRDFTAALNLNPKNALLASELNKVKQAIDAANFDSNARLPLDIFQYDLSSLSIAESSQNFERAWREHAHVPARLYRCLKLVPSTRLPRLFGASLESTHIADITAALEHGYQTFNDYELVHKVLSALPAANRFSLALLFLDAKVKERIQRLLEQVASSADAKSLIATYQ